MPDQTASLALPLLAASQAQKHITHNEALNALDAMVQISVLDRDLTEPPGGTADGDRYIPAGPATGDWAGQENAIAVARDGAWVFYAPREGWLAWVADEDQIIGWDGGSWTGAGGANAAFKTLGVNFAVADVTNRIAVNAPATLLNHDGDDHQLKLNKATTGDTASVLFQTGFSGRAEFGLIGDDQLSFKFSADGDTFTEVFRVDAATGHLALHRSSADRALHLGGPANPGIRLQEDGSSGYGELVSTSASQTLLSHFSPPGEGALIDLAPMPSDGTSSAAFRFFRGTNTSHGCYLTIHAGDGTAAFNHQLSGKWDSYLHASAGNLRIGASTPPVCKLDVAGPVRVGSYTVATLPSAAAGAAQVIYVSDESGGPVLAFSDGTNWRRSTDRAIIS